MPLIIPEKLPAGDLLEKENIFIMHEARASSQDIRPLKILVVNLLADKAIGETQIARLLANSPLQVELTLAGLKTGEQTNIQEDYLKEFYHSPEEIKNLRFDGMVLAGMPEIYGSEGAGSLNEEVAELLEYAKKNVYSSIYLAEGAEAGLEYHFGIKCNEGRACSGVFEHKTLRRKSPLLRGFDDVFWSVRAGNASPNRGQLEAVPALRLLAESEAAGVYLLATDNGRQIFVFGHPEYDRESLGIAYYRAVREGKNPDIPVNYFKEDVAGKEVMVRWRGHGAMLFSNWLNYYVYQETPYDLSQL